MQTRGGWAALIAVAAAAVAAAPAAGEPLVGVVGAGPGALVSFDSSLAGGVGGLQGVSGLAGGPSERIVGIAYRERLYAVTAVPTGAVRLYTVDPGNGDARLVSRTAVPLAAGDAYGVAFDPSGRLRVVNDAGENARLDASTGARVDATDPGLPASRAVAAIAYGAGTLYGLATAPPALVRIDGGTLTTVGAATPLDAFIAPDTANLEISPSGTAYATAWASPIAVPFLFRADLATGALTPVGSTGVALRGLAAVPAANVALAPAAATVSEAAGSAAFTVTRSGPTNRTTLVDWAASDGSAGGPLLFAPGETARTVVVPIANDGTDEPDRTVTLTLAARDALTAPGPAATLRIADDDAPIVRDRRAARVRISAPRRVFLGAFRRGLEVRITPSEAAQLDVTLEGTVTRARLSRYNVALARRTLVRAPGARNVTLKPSRRLVGKPRKAFKVRVRVVATDGAGNVGRASRTVTVRR